MITLIDGTVKIDGTGSELMVEAACISIQTCEVLEGSLPPKASAMVKEWIGNNKNELLNMWETQQFRTLSPLE